jgi:hypothetical protein
MLVIYRCATTLRLWTPLQRAEHHDLFMELSTQLEDTTRNIFPTQIDLHSP